MLHARALCQIYPDFSRAELFNYAVDGEGGGGASGEILAGATQMGDLVGGWGKIKRWGCHDVYIYIYIIKINVATDEGNSRNEI